MVNRFTSDKNNTKILHGNDTDVSYCTIVRHHRDLFVFTILWVPEDDAVPRPKTVMMNADEFGTHFKLQYGSPMDYISREDYEWMIE